MALHMSAGHRVFFAFFLFLLVLGLILLPSRVTTGQDVTETTTIEQPSIPTLLPTDRPAPTETPTETLTSTETPTETPFPTASETATLTATPTETPLLPSDTPTIETIPSATPIVSLVTLLSETAEQDLTFWTTTGGFNRSNMAQAHTGNWFISTTSPQYAADTVAILSLSNSLTIPVNASTQLQYWQRLDLGTGDTVQVQISLDTINWAAISTETAVRNLAWTVRTVDLSSYAGQTLWLRLVLAADADPQTVGQGWWLDDILVQAKPLPVTPLVGLTTLDSDDSNLWFTEGNWQSVSASTYDGGIAWMSLPEAETSVALTLNVDFNLTALAQPELRFWNTLNLGPEGDIAQVQVSTDGGQNWISVVNYTTSNNVDVWAEQTVSLASYAEQSIRIRFLLTTNGDGISGTGWNIDSIILQSATTVTSTPTLTPTLPPAETITVTSTEVDSTWATYEDTDPLLVYENGVWQTFNVTGAVGGTLTGTADPGATLTVVFEGSGIRLIYSKGPEGGTFSGWVDGSMVQTANGLAETYNYGYVMTFDGLPLEQHTLTITNEDGAIWIEAIQAQGVVIESLVITPIEGSTCEKVEVGISTKSLPSDCSTGNPRGEVLFAAMSSETGLGPFNDRLAIQVNSTGQFNMGAFPDATGGATENSWDIMFYWPESPWSSFSTVRVDNVDTSYGDSSGMFIQPPTDIDGSTNTAIWQVGQVKVTQLLQIVLNPATGEEDLGKISYTVENLDTTSHQVGLRIMIDTEINYHDGAPFRVPNTGIVTQETEFAGANVPENFQVFPSVIDSSFVASAILRRAGEISPDRLILARWPYIKVTPYDYTVNPSEDFTSDSAYAVYWLPQNLEPGSSRTYTTYYGLGNVTTDLQPPLALALSGPAELSILDGSYSPNPFEIVATVLNNELNAVPVDNVQLTLSLPAGLTVQGDTAFNVGTLQPGQEVQHSWLVTAENTYSPIILEYSVTVTGTNTQPKAVARSISIPAATPPDCPWENSTFIPPIPGDPQCSEGCCSYQYDRTEAKQYAQTYAPQPVSTSLFCTFNFPKGVNNCDAPSDASDCANFVSQSIFYGGLPMINDGGRNSPNSWYCLNLPCGSGHDITNNELAYSLSWTGAGTNEQPTHWTPLSGEAIVQAPGSYFDPAVRVNWELANPEAVNRVKAVGAQMNALGMGVGDIMSVPVGDLPHSAIVVGWGPVVFSWDQILIQNIVSEYSLDNPIPYVVDHGPQGSIPTVDRAYSRPRPYYALYWAIYDDRGHEISETGLVQQNNAPTFIHIPDTILVPISNIGNIVEPTFSTNDMLSH